MLSHRIQGLVLMAVVFVVVLVVLTIVQAVEGDWFIYSGECSKMPCTPFPVRNQSLVVV